MSKDIDKTVIRIVQDYCFGIGANALIDDFIHTVVPLIVKHIKESGLEEKALEKVLQKRKDYFIANNLDLEDFCEGLLRKLNYELSFYSSPPLFDSILLFKQDMENGNAKSFQKNNVDEDLLRSVLNLYLDEKTYCEPRVGAGNCDIIIPDEKTIIETKIWRGKEYYQAAFPELNEYLEKEKFTEGYYIIFDFNKKLNEVIRERGQVFEEKYQGKTIHVIFVRMNPPSPSQLYKN